MDEKPVNYQKYDNYKEQFKRLDKAIRNHYYLEAMFIAYAIIEDRADSILSYENNQINSDRFVSIERKLNKIKKIAEKKKSLPERYFSDGLIDEILEWKNERNKLIHALMKQPLTSEQLYETALEGKDLARQFANKATNYRRAVQARNNEGE